MTQTILAQLRIKRSPYGSQTVRKCLKNILDALACRRLRACEEGLCLLNIATVRPASLLSENEVTVCFHLIDCLSRVVRKSLCLPDSPTRQSLCLFPLTSQQGTTTVADEEEVCGAFHRSLALRLSYLLAIIYICHRSQIRQILEARILKSFFLLLSYSNLFLFVIRAARLLRKPFKQ